MLWLGKTALVPALCAVALFGQINPAPKLPDANRIGLKLEDVLASVEQQYPPLLAALRDRVIADADVTTAEGRFDLTVRSGYEGDYLGTYGNDEVSAGVSQATRFQGLSYYTGWHLGVGDFAGYDGKRQTNSGGEYKTGLKLPLFRDRAIDSRRSEWQKAVLGRRVADLGIESQRLMILQMATRRYWDWVAAGQRFQVAQAVLKVAEQRDQQLKDSFQLGQIPEIDVKDNVRTILARRSAVIEAERLVQQATYELSLFYRDGQGQPVLAREEQLPPSFPETKALNEQRLQDDIELAWKRRPEMMRFAMQREQVEVDRRLAQNQLLPGIDFALAYTRQSGDEVVKRGPNEVTAGVIFDLPLQRRQAKGREQSAVARIQQFDLREKFAREQVAVEVRDAYSAVQAAQQRARILRQEMELALELENAERVRFSLGDGTLFVVNLREAQTFDTALREVGALNEYFRALAAYEYAIAEAVNKRFGPAQP